MTNAARRSASLVLRHSSFFGHWCFVIRHLIPHSALRTSHLHEHPPHHPHPDDGLPAGLSAGDGDAVAQRAGGTGRFVAQPDDLHQLERGDDFD